MKLVWSKVNGFKRFGSSNKIHLDSKIVAVLGPNEVGKSSFLQALLHFNASSAFRSSGPTQELTRGSEFDEDHTVIEATYLLEKNDLAALEEVPEAAHSRWMSAAKRVRGGRFTARIQPSPKRNKEPRASLAKELKEIRDELMGQDEKLGEDQEDGEEYTYLDVDPCIEILQGTQETLSDDSIAKLEELSRLVRDVGIVSDSESIRNLAIKISELVSIETAEHPEKRARDILWGRRPQFLYFSDEDRLLSSSYNLHSYFKDDKPVEIPRALQNLADAALLNLEDLYRSQRENDEGKKETILISANNNLAIMMKSAWSQSQMTVRLRLDGTTLYILVGNLESQFVNIAERSDGMRQFIALISYLKHFPDLSVPPILLIDEVERHLHYDAQADIVQMLARQNIASKVIYTTHSLGCLPEDLGSGVRLVEPVDQSHSRFVNWFWCDDTPGFSRILFGMGANTLSFVPVRYSVVAEGPSDLILLPLLLKEAMSQESLGYQVVPGLSVSTQDQIAIVNNQSLRTMYLVDGDDAGDRLAAKIRAAGIGDDRILKLSVGVPETLVIEDVLDLRVYIDAVNEELRRSNGGGFQVNIDDFTTGNRPQILKRLCLEAEVGVPHKCAIAYRVSEGRYDRPVLDTSKRHLLTDLHIAVLTGLGIQA